MDTRRSVTYGDDEKLLLERLRRKLKCNDQPLWLRGLWILGEQEGFAVDGELLPDWKKEKAG
ncbi:MAG: hypothetical protein ACR2QF_14990 [Geminicoccaceae bacterium]